jgi:hypothetical protein
MTEIACSCLLSQDEMIYDRFTDYFLFIIRQSITIRSLALESNTLAALLEVDHGPDIPKHSFDRSWIPPLLFTALKCRVPRIRLQAIRLLECSSHKEGIWDSCLAACIARKVKDVERSFLDDNMFEKEFELGACPRTEDLPPPCILDKQRVYQVRVSLPHDRTSSMLLTCLQRNKEDGWSTTQFTYNLLSRNWSNS